MSAQVVADNLSPKELDELFQHFQYFLGQDDVEDTVAIDSTPRAISQKEAKTVRDAHSKVHKDQNGIVFPAKRDDKTFSGEIKVRDLVRLIDGLGKNRPGYTFWLNDEIVNYYLGLISMHDDQVFVFNSHFIEKMRTEPEKVVGWGNNSGYQKYKIKEMRKLVVPVNLDKNHWAVIVADFGKLEIVYYDSLINSDKHDQYREALYQVFEFIVMAGRLSGAGTFTAKFDVTLKPAADAESSAADTESSQHWKLKLETNTPQQTDDKNCGVYALRFAVMAALDVKIDGDNWVDKMGSGAWSPTTIMQWRERILADIASGQLTN